MTLRRGTRAPAIGRDGSDAVPGSVERTARRVSLAVVLLVGVVGTWCAIGLYADGTFFLLRILSDDALFVANPGRTFVTVLTQLPMLMAMRAGVQDRDILIHLHSAGLTLLPSLAWAAALWLQRRGRLYWVFLTMWAATYLVSGFFAIGEFNTTYALVALAAALLLTARVHLPRAGLVLATALVLLRSYESMLFLGPALMLVCALAAVRSLHHGRVDRRFLPAAAVLALGTVTFGLDTVNAFVVLRSPENPGRIGTSLDLALLAQDPRLVLAGAATAGLVVCLVLKDRLSQGMVVAVVSVGAIPLFLAPFGALVPSPVAHHFMLGFPGNYAYYQSRVAAGGLLLLLLCIALVVDLLGRRSKAAEPVTRDRAWPIAASVAVSLATIFLANCLAFSGWVDEYRQEVRSGTGLVAFERARIDQRFAWTWTNPSLSILLQEHPGQETVLNPAGYVGWQPFDPAAGVPRLATPYREGRGEHGVR
jgi:hypothetical protein